MIELELNKVLKESNYRNNKNFNQNQLNRIFAVVEEVGECCQSAKVRIMDNKNLTIELPNKTNLPLTTGDNVWIYYWKDIGSGYIALNNTSKYSNILSSIELGSVTITIPEDYSLLSKHTYVSCSIPHSSKAKIFTEQKKGEFYQIISKMTDNNSIFISVWSTNSKALSKDTVVIDYLIIG